jgi:hypothetical protein
MADVGYNPFAAAAPPPAVGAGAADDLPMPAAATRGGDPRMPTLDSSAAQLAAGDPVGFGVANQYASQFEESSRNRRVGPAAPMSAALGAPRSASLAALFGADAVATADDPPMPAVVGAAAAAPRGSLGLAPSSPRVPAGRGTGRGAG